MGSRSKSSTTSNTRVTTNTETNAFNLSDSATAIQGDGNTIVNNSMDADVANNALFAAESLGDGAFSLAGSLGSDALFAGASLGESAERLGDGAFNLAGMLGGDALATAEGLGGRAFDSADYLGDRAAEMGQGAFDLSKYTTDNMAGVSEGGFNLADSLGTSALFASENLAESGFDLSRDIATGGFDLSRDVLTGGAEMLGGLAEMQERGLNNALSVAASFGKDDGAEVAESAIKYVAIAAVVMGVAMMFRGRK